MEDALRTLKKKRLGMMLLNLAYFVALLLLGVAVFLKNAGGTGYLLIGLCLAAYLLAVRPVSRRYTAALREAILRHSVCGELEDFQYQPKSGVSWETVGGSGLISTSSEAAFISREHITGRCGTMAVELADVTFPIVEDSRNAMFSGAVLQLTWPEAGFAPATVRAGELEGLELPKQQLELVEQLGSLIPGSLYLQTREDRITVLLRGRFLGFPINPLTPVTEKTLEANVFPELRQALQLARLMRMTRR